MRYTAEEGSVSNGERWVSIVDLADELDVPVATVYQWRSKGHGPRGDKFGRHVRFRRSDVDAWVAGRLDPAGPA